MLFINPTLMATEQELLTVQLLFFFFFFDGISVPRSDVRVSDRKPERLTVLYASVLQVWCA